MKLEEEKKRLAEENSPFELDPDQIKIDLAIPAAHKCSGGANVGIDADESGKLKPMIWFSMDKYAHSNLM